MIAKLCTHASTRERAIDGMAAALDGFFIEGVENNVPFLTAIMRHKRFRDGKLTTGFIAEEYPDGFHGAPLGKDDEKLFALAALAVQLTLAQRATRISNQFDGPPRAGDHFVVALGENSVEAKHVHLAAGRLKAQLGSRAVEADVVWEPGQPILRLRSGDVAATFKVHRRAGGWLLEHGGARLTCAVRAPSAAALAALMPKKKAADTSKFLLCPMPGLVVSVNVKEGQEVKAGETLAVVEAMKMENVLLAERDGVVKSIKAKKGDSLAVDDVILEFA
jgi:propionyl-CoA carboxylase alpha chain